MATNHRPVNAKPATRGPVLLAFELIMGLIMVSVSATVLGLLIEVGGMYTIWKGQGTQHARAMVEQDLGYIAAAPKSLLIADTVGFSQKLTGYIAWPFEKFGVLRWYVNAHATKAAPAPQVQGQVSASSRIPNSLKGTTHDVGKLVSTLLVLTMYVAMDVALRLSIALYALPAFVLACLVGTVDGLVRRDLRRWSGGRESSFVYHHAKRYTSWALTGGFGLYLTWPFGGFNPGYMVLVFAVLVAASLSTTVAAFKKYV